jgi:uncharacterized protein (TIGR02246 family)
MTAKIVELFGTLLEAWNRRDASAMAALYAPHGCQIGFDGNTTKGPQNIERYLSGVFRDHAMPRFVSKVRDVRDLGPNVAILCAVSGMIPDGRSGITPDLNTVQTLIASRSRKDEWRIELFQNTPAAFDGRPEEREKLTQELREVAAG